MVPETCMHAHEEASRVRRQTWTPVLRQRHINFQYFSNKSMRQNLAGHIEDAFVRIYDMQ